MRDSKNMIDSYEILHVIHLTDGAVVFAEDCAAAEPYMVCDRAKNQLFTQYNNVCVSDDYVEAMREFITRVSSHIDAIEATRKNLDLSLIPLTEADCIEGSKYSDFTNEVIVIKPEVLIPSARTADHQLLFAQSGFGCSPDSRGSNVYCKTLTDGTECRYDRSDVAGIIKPSLIPEWATEMLSDLRNDVDKADRPLPKVNRSKNDAR